MKSWRTSNFKKLYNALPKEVQRPADEAYRLWRQDPSHIARTASRQGQCKR